jgi:sialic acid synthase SpsE
MDFRIGDRRIGPDDPPFVIPEIGINHEGIFERAIQMVDDAAEAGAECVKFQCHVVDDEMIPNDVVPGNTSETIWNIMARCALPLEEERAVKAHVESKGMFYLSTPFSRAAADRLESLGVQAYKVGSGECNNYPLVEHIAGFGKPMIMSTGMNDIESVRPSVEIMRRAGVPFALLHCTSVYPTPPSLVRLGALAELRAAFPDAVVGLSDHTLTIHPAVGAVALGASIVERHFTSDRSWPGPDIEISMTPPELAELIEGSRLVWEASGGSKAILEQESPTIAFAYATVVTIADISAGEALTRDNLWVKRPGTGEIRAVDFERVLGRRAAKPLARDTQVAWVDLSD